MPTPTEYRVFLASSEELAVDRLAFAEMLRRRNEDWVGRGVHLRLAVWEDFLDAVSNTRKQDDYNAELRKCHVFVMLFHTKVGMYTEEEFNAARKQFKKTGKPLIYTYFKTAAVDPDADLSSRKAFQQRLKDLEHFQTRYENVEGLLLHFWQQLDKLVANGFIRFPAEGDGGTDLQLPTNILHAGAVQVQGDNRGVINTGTLHMGDFRAGRRQ